VRRQTARDTVLEQSPPAGREVKEGDTVVLTVSSGPGTVEVPKVAGLSERRARERLEELFRVKVEERFSDRFEEGTAIGTRPEEGVEVPTGSTVALIVSLGVELVSVPNVTGRTQAQAEVSLADAGLDVRVEERSSFEPEGKVLDQSPLPGTEVERGERVTIFVSSGEFEVVDVVGEREDVARRRLETQGLRVSVEREPVASNRQIGRVIEQSPPGGTMTSRGSRVVITVGISAEEELDAEEELF
jgi:serine/threonine-protein kinase